MTFQTDVVVRKTLHDMVKERDLALRYWCDGYRLLQKSREYCTENSRYGGPTLYDVAGPEKAEHQIDSMFWRASFERTGMTQIMDHKAITEFQNSLEKEPPTFSMENIESQYLTMYQDAEMMFRRGIYEVFRNLDHSYWNNNHEPYQLSSRNIVLGLFDTWGCKWNDGGPRLSHYKSDTVNDIDRCVKVLTHRKHEPRELETKVNAAMKEKPWVYEDDDYQIKGFKNGNGHFLFKDDTVIDKLNREIAAYCNHHKLTEDE